MTSRGVWSAAVTYKLDDLVTSRGSAWRAKRASKNKLPGQTASSPLPSTASDWELFAAGFNSAGAWVASKFYHVNDLVTRDGTVWRAKRTSKGKTPIAGADWEQFAAKGNKGDTGDDRGDRRRPGRLDNGPTGATGATGATGSTGPHGHHRGAGTRKVRRATGATGTLASAYAYIYNVSAQSVPGNSAVKFDSNGAMSSNITHIAGNTFGVITLNASGTYLITFHATAFLDEPGTLLFSIYRNNNVLVPGSRSFGGATGGDPSDYITVDGSVIVQITAGDSIQLKSNGSTASLPVLDEIFYTFTNASITIVRIN